MAKDLTLEDSDLQIKNGDFVVGLSDRQHVKHLLLAHQGEYKQWPVLGIGISDYLKAPLSPKTTERLERITRQHIEADGASNVKVNVLLTGKIDIDANYGD